MLADTRRVVRRRLAACAARLRPDCACTSYSVFKEPTRPRKARPSRRAFHPAWQVLTSPFRPNSGEPSKVTIAVSGCQPPPCTVTSTAAPKTPEPKRPPLRLGWNLPSCCPTWEPGDRELGDLRTPKANLDTTRRGRVCQPLHPARFSREAASHTAGQVHANSLRAYLSPANLSNHQNQPVSKSSMPAFNDGYASITTRRTACRPA